MDKPQHRPLRVGLLVDTLELPAWNFELLRQFKAEDWLEVAIVVRKSNSASDPRTLLQRLDSARRNFAYAIYTRIDERLFASQCQPNAFQTQDIKNVVAGVPILNVTPRETKFSDFLLDEDVQQIKDANVDVLLRWGFRILRGEVLNAARYGIWSFHHGDNRVNRGSLPGLWEVIEGMHTTGSVLQRLSEQLDGGKTIDRFVGATRKTSVALNQHNLYWKTSPMLLKSLRQLYENGIAFETMGEEENQTPAPYCHPLRSQPTNAKMISGIANMVGHVIGQKAKHVLHYDQWFLAYRLGKNEDDPNDAFYQYKRILPPKDRFWADPFVVERDDRYYVFFEEYFYATDRAHISVLEIDQQGNWSSPRMIIQRPYHLSYPFVFEHEGDLFLIPESGENKTIEMYRCTNFPDQWELDSEIMSDIDAADTTLYQQDGKWWMFVSITEKNLRNRDTCYVFFADTPRGPWTPHPQNPIKRDVRNARMAGNLFKRNGRLYRPAQDCAERYGVGIKINEVLELSEDRYEERLVSEITPNWDPMVIGTHTINRAGRLTIIDGEMLRSRFF